MNFSQSVSADFRKSCLTEGKMDVLETVVELLLNNVLPPGIVAKVSSIERLKGFTVEAVDESGETVVTECCEPVITLAIDIETLDDYR